MILVLAAQVERMPWLIEAVFSNKLVNVELPGLKIRTVVRGEDRSPAANGEEPGQRLQLSAQDERGQIDSAKSVDRIERMLALRCQFRTAAL